MDKFFPGLDRLTLPTTPSTSWLVLDSWMTPCSIRNDSLEGPTIKTTVRIRAVPIIGSAKISATDIGILAHIGNQ